jgi:glycerol-3-phosphate dehydrogenase (NAD(P)+)
VPVAVSGTEAIRRGWRIRPHRVRLRAGRPLRFPQVDEPSKALAAAVTDRIWPCVMLQWEWLGGLAPVRRVAVIGAGQWGTALAVCLAQAGMEVDLGCRTAQQAQVLHDTRVNSRYLPDVTLPDAVQVMPACELSLEIVDLVCLAVPARALPAVLADHGGQITGSTGVVVVSQGLVPPLGTLPAAFAAEHSGARATAVLGGPAYATQLLAPGTSVVVASLDRGFSRQLADVLTAAGLDIAATTDVTGVELAACAMNAAVLAAAAASGAGAGVADAAAGKVFAEVSALARARGGRPETFAGLAAAGEAFADSVSVAEMSRAQEQGAEAVESVPLLASAAHAARLDAPALDGLAALLEGRIEPEQWAATVTAPPGAKDHEQSGPRRPPARVGS